MNLMLSMYLFVMNFLCAGPFASSSEQAMGVSVTPLFGSLVFIILVLLALVVIVLLIVIIILLIIRMLRKK